MKQALMRGLGGPAVEAGEDLYQGAKRSGGELMQAGKSLLHGNPAEAAVHGMNAVPIVGPAMVNAAEKPDVGGTGSYSGDLMSVLKSPSAMGTLVGGAAQAALTVAGAGDVMAPERTQFGQIPSRARAVKTLNSIEQKAANTPVSMSRTAPALKDFDQHVATGGKGAEVMTKLGKRIGDIAPEQKPIDYVKMGRDSDIEATAKNIGEPPAGQTRLFRSESPTTKFEDVFNKEKLNDNRPSGKAYTNDLGSADYYRQSYGPDARTHYMDLPDQAAQGFKWGNEYVVDPDKLPSGKPVNFPEARKFYTNVSDVTRKPGALRRLFEDSREPRLRMAAGPVREGMNADLTEALKPLNLDEDYTNALKEYAQGKALKTGLKRAGAAAIGAGAGAAGLGKIHNIASSVLR